MWPSEFNVQSQLAKQQVVVASIPQRNVDPVAIEIHRDKGAVQPLVVLPDVKFMWMIVWIMCSFSVCFSPRCFVADCTWVIIGRGCDAVTIIGTVGVGVNLLQNT